MRSAANGVIISSSKSWKPLFVHSDEPVFLEANKPYSDQSVNRNLL